MKKVYRTSIFTAALGLLLAGPAGAETVCIDVDGPGGPFKVGPPGASFKTLDEQQKWALVATLAARIKPGQIDSQKSFSVLLQPDGTASIGMYKNLLGNAYPDVKLQNEWTADELGNTFQTNISGSEFSIDGEMDWQELRDGDVAPAKGSRMLQFQEKTR